MRLTRQSRRSRSEDNLMPMINVVFLLLIFFMVAGTIDRPVTIETNPPDSTQRQEISASSTLHIATDGKMALDTDTVTIDTLADAIQSDALQSDLLAVRADGNITMEQLQPVLHTLRQAGIMQIELVTTWIPVDTR